MADTTDRADEITTLALRAERFRRGASAGEVGWAPVAGCWCGGAGGRDVAYLPDPLGVERAAPGHPDLLRVYREYCPCAAGQSLKRLEDAVRAAVFAAQDELRAARLWGATGVPPHYRDLTLDTYPSTPESAPAVGRVREWLTTDDRWLFLWGAYGTGKTGLAVAAMRERVRAARAANPTGGREAGARFITVPDLLARLRQSYDRDGGAGGGRVAGGFGGGGHSGGASERELLDDLDGVPLLVLDDLGAERATDWAVERLFGLLNRRHDWHRPTVLTSNLGPKQLAEHLGERIAWRIVEMCRLGDEDGARFMVELRGPNLRDRAKGRSDRRSGDPARVLSGPEPSHRHGMRDRELHEASGEGAREGSTP
jgi:DNA replication protein DnaC